MNLYSLLFPDDTRPDRVNIIITLLSLDGASPNLLTNLRLRDAWIERGGGRTLAAVYTRNGGGNRECYCGGYGDGDCIGCCGDQATEHPLYAYDADDDFDYTYRTYWFELPAKLTNEQRQTLESMAENPRDVSNNWQKLLNSL